MTEALFVSLSVLGGQIQASGLSGDVTLLALFAVSSAVSLVPRPALCVVAGAAYGYWGLPIAFAGTMIGCSLAFGIGHAFSPRILGFAGRHPRIMALLDAVRSEGWRAVLLLRLAPSLPSSLLSLAFGMSEVRFLPYFLATLAGVLPGILLEVAIGATGGAMARGDLVPVQLCFIGLGILAGAIAVYLLVRQARKRVRSSFDQPPR